MPPADIGKIYISMIVSAVPRFNVVSYKGVSLADTDSLLATTVAGRALALAFASAGYEVVTLSRINGHRGGGKPPTPSWVMREGPQLPVWRVAGGSIDSIFLDDSASIPKDGPPVLRHFGYNPVIIPDPHSAELIRSALSAMSGGNLDGALGNPETLPIYLNGNDGAALIGLGLGRGQAEILHRELFHRTQWSAMCAEIAQLPRRSLNDAGIRQAELGGVYAKFNALIPFFEAFTRTYHAIFKGANKEAAVMTLLLAEKA